MSPTRVCIKLTKALASLTTLAEVGIVRLTIHQAKSLDKSKSLSGDINPMAKLFLNGDTRNAVFATHRLRRGRRLRPHSGCGARSVR